MKTIIANGTLLDGLGNEPFRADLLIEDDRILDIGSFADVPADVKIDATGLTVAPGFVDIHRHPDLAALSGEWGPGELAQGITTVVGGNCGLSPVPMRREYEKDCRAFLSPCLGISQAPVPDSLDGYFRAVQKQGLPVNMGMLAAAGAIKIWTRGFGDGVFTRQEMQTAQSMLRTLLEEGALGISLGVMYVPECYTTTQEYVEWLSAAAPYGRPVCCHIRGEGASLVDSVAEVIGIGRAAGLPVHISHFKSTGIQNWGRLIHVAIDQIEKARDEGQDVTADFYPYNAGASTLLSLVPPSLQAMGREELCARAGHRDIKDEMKRVLYGATPGWDNMVQDIGWSRILLTGGPGAEEFAGLDLAEIARRMGAEDPCDAMCEILAETNGQAGVVLQSMSDEDIRAIARLPYTFLISDALYGSGAAHPRQKGAFPEFLQTFVPDVLPLPEAIRKMTSMPADRLGIRGRGRLAKGCFADVAVFSEMEELPTFVHPHRLARGMRCLLLNGQPVWPAEQASLTARGRVIRFER